MGKKHEWSDNHTGFQQTYFEKKREAVNGKIITQAVCCKCPSLGDFLVELSPAIVEVVICSFPVH